jgi:acetolactate synthase I/II/III large subunit
MAQIKVSDYLIKRVADLGVKHIFMVTGGGAMHLDDSIGNEKRLEYICNHHEQACAIAAEGYARVRGDLAVVCVTTGPGGTNTLTGVMGQWHDSVPVLYISGQVKYETTVASTELPMRQLGDQEGPIVDIVKPVTKYAIMVTDPKSIRYHFEKAVYLARTGRPGPVWLDLPLNVQGAMVDETDLYPYEPDSSPVFDEEKARAGAQHVFARLSDAERPVILAGSGIMTSRAQEEFLELVRLLNIPVLTAWNAQEVVPMDFPLWFGRPSTFGDRAGNFIIQNSDLMISVGCRLNVRQIGYEFKAFAREAYRVVVDIDECELEKPTIFPDLPIHADAGFFIKVLSKVVGNTPLPPKKDWLDWCAKRKRRYPVVLPEYYEEKEYVNPYVFINELSKAMNEDSITVVGNGTACVVGFQAFNVKNGQRLIGNSGTASMGYDLPAAIGACLASGRQPIVCLAGDGSLQMNIQELQTVVHHNLPIKVFVLNNGGYLSIRQTQDNMFGGHYVGEGPTSGISFPDFIKVAEAYGLPAIQIRNQTELKAKLQEVLSMRSPVVCDVKLSPSQFFMPKAASQRLSDGRIISKPLEDMYPFLDREEFRENMIIAEWRPEH